MFTERNLIAIFLRKVIALLIATTFAIVGAFIIGAQISKIKTSLIEIKRSAYVLEKRGETVAGLRVDFVRVGKIEDAIATAFIPDDNIVDFIATLDALALTHSLSASSQFSSPSAQLTMADGTVISALDFSINANGNYATLMKYVAGFNELPYLTSISNISLNSNASKGIEESASISIQGRVYTKGIPQ